MLFRVGKIKKSGDDSQRMNYSLGLNLPLFRGVDPKTYSLMIEGASYIQVKHREVLFSLEEPASHFAIVLAGGFKLVKPTVAGNDVIMHFACPGDVIGVLLMVGTDARYPVSSISMGNSSVLKIPGETYRKNWQGNPVIQAKLNAILATWMARMQADKGMLKASLPERIADLLLRLMNTPEENKTEVPVPLTRQEIADSVGASVESVIRVMSEWNQSGVIKSEKNKLLILMPEQLKAIVPR
jgi:CRP/FNR family transcriptional regulator